MKDPWENIRNAEFDAVGAEARYTETDPTIAMRDPGHIALTFIQALQEPTEYQDVLEQLVTPESFPNWGDFQEASEALAAINDWGLGSEPNRAFEARDVAYAKILRGVVESFQFAESGPVPVAAILSMVWRPEYGRWMIHRFGHDVPLNDMPRTSPDEAP